MINAIAARTRILFFSKLLPRCAVTRYSFSSIARSTSPGLLDTFNKDAPDSTLARTKAKMLEEVAAIPKNPGYERIEQSREFAEAVRAMKKASVPGGFGH